METKPNIIVDVGIVYSYLRTEDVELKALFHKSLKFRSKGYIFSPQYQKWRRSGGKSGWDGYTSFFTLVQGKFGTGLLPEILKGLESLKLKFSVVDNRPRLGYTKISPELFASVNVELRDYQVSLGNQCLDEMRGIIKVPTGAGKTVLFNAIIKSLAEATPTIVLFRNRGLVNQTYGVLQKLGIHNVGRVHMDFFEPDIVTCSTIQSIHHLAPLVPKIRALILDECHEYSSNRSVKIIRAFENASMVLGFSATPFDRADKVAKYTLKSLIGPIIGDITTAELQDRGILAESRIHIIPIVEPKIPYALFEEAEIKGIVGNVHRNQMIKKIVDSYPNGKILILVEKIDHGDNLKQLIPEASWIHGSTEDEERELAAKALNSGDKAVVIASRIWAQGVDIPCIDVLVNASGGRSEKAAIQKLGRGLRKTPTKDFLDFYDFYDSTNLYLERHSKERLKTYKREGHEILPTEPL